MRTLMKIWVGMKNLCYRHHKRALLRLCAVDFLSDAKRA